MKWIAKAVVQKTISFLPGSHKINYLFQKYVTKGVYLTEDYFEDRLTHAAAHVRSFNEYRGSLEGVTTMELGTGWYPVVPITMFLCGANEIVTVDIDRLLTKERLQTTLAMFQRYLGEERLNGLPLSPRRLQELLELAGNISSWNLQEALHRLRIKYMVTDARQLPIDSDSIDMVHSNNTFEHVYAVVLSDILKEMKRVVKKNHQGVMSHAIDLSDHFAHFDTSISVYNFLKFSDQQWKWIDNSIQPMNRLRQSDYLKIYKQLDIPITNVVSHAPRKEALSDVSPDDKYKTYERDDLAITQCRIVSVL